MTYPIHEHYIAQDNLLPKFRDKITLPSAVNLTGAVFKFRYAKTGEAAVERNASVVSGSAIPSLAAATSFDLEFAPIDADTAAAGVFNYQWRITLQGETAPLDLPNEVEPETDGSPRKFQRFEVTETL
jgi:hypothetical protein